MPDPFSRLEKAAYRLTMAVLAVTGMAQMPIFKRYRIADVPGLAWTADFFFTHWLHIVGAAALLFLLGRLAGRGALSRLGVGRGVLLLTLAATGAVRLAKNLPGVSFDPTATMLIDWIHLGAAGALGLAALAAALAGRLTRSRRSAMRAACMLLTAALALGLAPEAQASGKTCPPFFLRDDAGRVINPVAGENADKPVSTRQTCGAEGCHDYAAITKGYHFQQGWDAISDTYNPAKPWMLSPGMMGKL